MTADSAVPPTTTGDYEATIRQAIKGDVYPPETAGSPHSLSRAVAAAIRPLVAAEVAAERERCARVALDAVPCVCDPAYYERGLIAPDCAHHDLADDLGVPARARVARVRGAVRD